MSLDQFIFYSVFLRQFRSDIDTCRLPSLTGHNVVNLYKLGILAIVESSPSPKNKILILALLVKLIIFRQRILIKSVRKQLNKLCQQT